MKRLLITTGFICFLSGAARAQNQIWEVIHTRIDTISEPSLKLVWFVDISSIRTIREVTYFKWSVAHYDLNGKTVMARGDGDKSKYGGSSAKVLCTSGKLSLGGSPPEIWKYLQPNGEWWSERDVTRGSRYVNHKVSKLFGYSSSSEANKHSDALDGGIFRVVCSR